MSANSSAVLELSDTEAPLWRYWGPRLPEDSVPGFGLRAGRATPTFSLEDDFPLSLFPTFGVGWYGKSALLAHRDGQDFAQAITACEVTWTDQGCALLVRLTDSVAGLLVEIDLALESASDVLTVSTRLTNTGAGVLDVQWLAAAVLPLPAQVAKVRHYGGRHNAEFLLQEEALARGIWRRENRRGLTSHDAFPGAVAVTPGAGTHAGLAFGAQLAWSGNHAQVIEWLEDGRYQWQLGEWLAPGEVRLAEGEQIVSPQVLATCSTGGLNGVAHGFHKAIRARLSWPGGVMSPRPVGLNTWEGVYFDLVPSALEDMAEAAARAGIERFILDDGWFQGRRSDRAGLGDWWTDAEVFPEGLGPLARRVNDLGMSYGLWVEPEMVNPDSDLFRAHPDWALQIAGRPLLTARNQLVLDLTRPEVADYLLEKIGALLDSLPIAYLKWDHNRDLTTAGTSGRAAYRRQTLAAYDLMARIREGWPQVEIEACAGGGGRMDAGVLQHTHRVWTSDCIDAVSRVAIQRGFLQFFPPEIMGSHVGAAQAHTTGRSQTLDFRAAVALPGHFGVELDPRGLDGAESTQLKGWIDLYKSFRGHLHQGQVWLGEGQDSLVWQAHGAVDDLLLFVYRMGPMTQKWPTDLALPMVAQDRVYRIEEVRPRPGSGKAAAPVFLEYRGGGVDIHGAWLANQGMPVPPRKAETCLIYRIRAEAQDD
jgi:alpha-galactosidase